MRRQQGHQDPREWLPSLAAGPRERGDLEPPGRDPDGDGGFEIEYEDDRFSTDHDDQAGRRWRINSDVDVDSDDRDGPRRRSGSSIDDDDDGERGVFRTRPYSTTPQDRDRRGRFSAEEARDTWSSFRQDAYPDRHAWGRDRPRYDDGSRTRGGPRGRESGSRGLDRGGRSSMQLDDDGSSRPGRDDASLAGGGFRRDLDRGFDRGFDRGPREWRREGEPPHRFDVREEQRRFDGRDDHRHFVQHEEQRRFERGRYDRDEPRRFDPGVRDRYDRDEPRRFDPGVRDRYDRDEPRRFDPGVRGPYDRDPPRRFEREAGRGGERDRGGDPRAFDPRRQESRGFDHRGFDHRGFDHRGRDGHLVNREGPDPRHLDAGRRGGERGGRGRAGMDAYRDDLHRRELQGPPRRDRDDARHGYDEQRWFEGGGRDRAGDRTADREDVRGRMGARDRGGNGRGGSRGDDHGN